MDSVWLLRNLWCLEFWGVSLLRLVPQPQHFPNGQNTRKHVQKKEKNSPTNVWVGVMVALSFGLRVRVLFYSSFLSFSEFTSVAWLEVTTESVEKWPKHKKNRWHFTGPAGIILFRNTTATFSIVWWPILYVRLFILKSHPLFDVTVTCVLIPYLTFL